MVEFEYLAPETLHQALNALQMHEAEARVIAGGTDLIPLMRAGAIMPSKVIDLRLCDLNQIILERDMVHLGATVTHAQVLQSGVLSDQFPALVQACAKIAGPPVRNRGTLGGNLVNASPAADTAPPLLVYDAEVVLERKGAKRTLPLCEFFKAPGETTLEPGEMLTEIRLARPSSSTAAEFLKLGQRRAMAIATVSAAVRLTLNEDGFIAQARIALGSVAPTPLRATRAERLLQGKAGAQELFAEAGNMASQDAAPISDIRASADYRKEMVAVLVRRALATAWRELGGA